MKTNKSYTKRLKVTKRGKVLAKKPGWGHFNAKERRTDQFKKKRWRGFAMKRKNHSRYLGT